MVRLERMQGTRRWMRRGTIHPGAAGDADRAGWCAMEVRGRRGAGRHGDDESQQPASWSLRETHPRPRHPKSPAALRAAGYLPDPTSDPSALSLASISPSALSARSNSSCASRARCWMLPPRTPRLVPGDTTPSPMPFASPAARWRCLRAPHGMNPRTVSVTTRMAIATAGAAHAWSSVGGGGGGGGGGAGGVAFPCRRPGI
jgi:hypothetical protein